MADTPTTSRRVSPWHTLIIAGLIAFAITAGITAWFLSRITQSPGHLLSGNITQQFSEYLPTVGAADGILETATASVPEHFTKTDSSSLFDVIPLGTTVSEIRVPAVYRYHICLFDPWKLETHGQLCLVLAPQFQPSLPPAIVTAQMEKSTSAGWLRFNAQENLDTLEQGVTAELTARANDKLHRDYVREACRQSVRDFVKAWLMKEDFWRPDKFLQIQVKFPDELPFYIPSRTGSD